MTDSTTLLNRIFPSPPSPDPETRKEVKDERDGLYSDLKLFQEKIQVAKEKEEISPETATDLQVIVSAAQEWMRKNPNANILEIRSQRDDIQQKADPIFERDKQRTLLDTYILQANAFLENEIQQGTYTKRQYTSAQQTLKTEQAWAKANRKETGLVYTQRLDALKVQLAKNLEVPLEKLSSLQETIQKAKPSAVKASIEKQQIATQQAKANTFDTGRLFETIFSTALSFFLGFILLTFFLFGGSLAANMAIGRDVRYRVFYFIFGSLPWIAPLVYINSALQSIRGQAPHYYGFLPVSTTPAVTILGKFFWWPFYYESDANSNTLKTAFESATEAVGRAVIQTPKPSPA